MTFQVHNVQFHKFCSRVLFFFSSSSKLSQKSSPRAAENLKSIFSYEEDHNLQSNSGNLCLAAKKQPVFQANFWHFGHKIFLLELSIERTIFNFWSIFQNCSKKFFIKGLAARLKLVVKTEDSSQHIGQQCQTEGCDEDKIAEIEHCAGQKR